MPYFIAAPCLDVLDKSCLEECPVDCIYEGARKMYINPDECIDCGACEPVCPETAISSDMRVPAELATWRTDDETFFTTVLAGRDRPLGSPGGAANIGAVGIDTDLATNTPAA